MPEQKKKMLAVIDAIDEIDPKNLQYIKNYIEAKMKALDAISEVSMTRHFYTSSDYMLSTETE